MKLSGNTILITGGSRGIGLQMAKAFLKEGNTVIITGRNAEQLEKIKAEHPELHTIQSDAGSPEDIQKLKTQIEKDFHELNILINNAGIMHQIDLQKHELSSEDLVKEITVNLNGTIWMNDAFIPLLKGKPNAATVSVSSGLAFAPLPITPVYCATKAGVHSYTMSLRVQLRNTSIKVFELAPPGTETDMMGSFDPEDMKGSTPMPVDKMVNVFMKGFAADKLEIRPGQANQLRFMSRFLPGVIQSVLNKPVDRMHASH